MTMKTFKYVVVLWSIVFVEFGKVTGESGYNIEESKILCDLLGAVEDVRKNIILREALKDSLKDAIYGSAHHNALIEGGGRVVKSRSCGKSFFGRGVFCNHKRGDGCFAQSLIGTFLCVCTPGQINRDRSLCGVGVQRYGRTTWSGGFVVSQNTQALFEKVFDKVIKNCNGGSQNNQGNAEKLKQLRSALETFNEKLKPGTISGKIFLYFGGKNKTSGCSGLSETDLCAAYEGYGDGSANVNIPWLTKIRKALEDLEAVERARTNVIHTQTQKGAGESNEGVASHDAPNAFLVQNESVFEEAGDQPAKNEPKSENTTTAGSPEEQPPKRKKRNIATSPFTDIPHVASDPNEDHSFIIQPFWLLLAALLN
ncbi:Variant surface glycoprotein [Trypanosoma congolense IL3000]|uniref:Variant surface glycoprotein n=1 Tax=Trypanosoma congolense (strain IL3000) TaxID=1068625 RepID=F9WDA3_TRYCI|nr:Variant surface glycoprotein [Trypanosoma congolense IL3000]